MTERSIAHGSFTVTRSYKAAPARVFQAFSNPTFKRQWFGTPKEGSTDILDFRVGGREYSEGKGPDGGDYVYDATYYDIVPDNRIVYAYDMLLNGARISVSVSTVELKPEGAGTRLDLTEHGAFLDGLDTIDQRRQGTEWFVDQLGEWLDKQS